MIFLCVFAVVPLAGTWIEIGSSVLTYTAMVSYPLRVRGLKFYWVLEQYRHQGVVPLAGTWIEITTWSSVNTYVASYPLRVRGLKLI